MLDGEEIKMKEIKAYLFLDNKEVEQIDKENTLLIMYNTYMRDAEKSFHIGVHEKDVKEFLMEESENIPKIPE